VLGDYAASGPTAEFAGLLASRLKTLISKPYEFGFGDDGKSFPSKYQPFEKGTLPSMAAVSARLTLNEALNPDKAVDAPTITDAKGAKFRPETSSGPVLVPAGSTYVTGGWRAVKTEDGLTVLAPPGFDSLEVHGGSACVFHSNYSNPIRIPLPEPGGSIVVSKSAGFFGPAWPCRIGRDCWTLIRPGKASVGSSGSVLWLSPGDSETRSAEAVAGAKFPADGIFCLPPHWRLTEANGGFRKLEFGEPIGKTDKSVTEATAVMYSASRRGTDLHAIIAEPGSVLGYSDSGYAMLISRTGSIITIRPD
jgi:hypothetical protein